MQFKKLLNQDDAVSPVIGVILMVAITVILAAVIGTFVLGLGDQVQDTAPNAQIAVDQSPTEIQAGDGGGGSGAYSTTSVELTHEGGEELDTSNVDVTVNGIQAWGVDTSTDPDSVSAVWDSGQISAGSSITIVAARTEADTEDFDTNAMYLDDTGDLGMADANDGTHTYLYSPTQLESGDTIRVTWTASSGDTSSTLRTYEVN